MTSSLIQTLAGEIGARTAGSVASRDAAAAVGEALAEAGVETHLQPFTFLGCEVGAPELTIEGTQWEAGPCAYAPATGSEWVSGVIVCVGEQAVRRPDFVTPVFAIEDGGGREVGRIYVNERGPAIPISAPHALVGPPALTIGKDDGVKLAGMLGASAKMRTVGDLVPQSADVNVVGAMAGRSTEAIVLGAHFDSVWRSPGAIDNASGIEGVRRIVERLRDTDWTRSVVVCSFGAEELGLLGASHFVSQARLTDELTRIVGMVNLDCIARGPKLEIIAATEELRELAKTVAQPLISDERYPVNIGPNLPGSDHWPFSQADIPTIAITFHSYPEYHTPDDTAELVDVGRFEDACDLAYRLVAAQLEGTRARP